MMQLISRYAIQTFSVSPRDGTPQAPGGMVVACRWSEPSVGGQPEQPVLDLVAVDPAADAQRVERRDVRQRPGVAVRQQVGELLGPAVARVEVDVERARGPA